jgi:hypothetical protein
MPCERFEHIPKPHRGALAAEGGQGLCQYQYLLSCHNGAFQIARLFADPVVAASFACPMFGILTQQYRAQQIEIGGTRRSSLGGLLLDSLPVKVAGEGGLAEVMMADRHVNSLATCD